MKTSVKTCFKCDIEKPITEFYRHPMMADGRLNKCKECTKQDVRKNRADNLEYYRAFDRARADDQKRVQARRRYAKSPAGIAAAERAKSKWTTKHNRKRKAQIYVGNAVRDGRLDKEPCEVCGSTDRIHGHHDDYSKPLDVRWLCPKHHGLVHRQINEIKRDSQ